MTSLFGPLLIAHRSHECRLCIDGGPLRSRHRLLRLGYKGRLEWRRQRRKRVIHPIQRFPTPLRLRYPLRRDVLPRIGYRCAFCFFFVGFARVNSRQLANLLVKDR